jgi:WD40 repeat protein
MIGETCRLHELRQHVGKVQSVDFSYDGIYLSTLGGQDDNDIVVWNVGTGTPICGFPAGLDSGLVCKWLHNRNDRFVTVGYYHVRVWQVDFRTPKLNPVDVKIGALRRIFSCVDITLDDQFAFCGTTTGDIVKIKLERDDIRSFNDSDAVVPNLLGITKDRISLGVHSVRCVINPATGNYNVVVGGGDGTLTYVNPNLGVVKNHTNNLKGSITSICENPRTGKLTVGTNQSNRYNVSRDLFEANLVASCHFGPIYDIAFPDGCPDLVVTSSEGDIRVWNILRKQELLRIQVPNVKCLCSVVSPSGTLILTGWDDGKIRAFYPESGKLKFTIADAHEKVTSIAVIDHDGSDTSSWRIISGGCEGKVRVWELTNSRQILVSSLKEHRGFVNCLKVSRDRSQCISASSDGSCIVWDLTRYVRIMALFETNMFESIVIHPDESQYLTCGSNHKITYWSAADGQAIRVIEGGNGVMTTMDIEPIDGEYFISGCEDKILKIWHYDEGELLAQGRGHSGVIKAAKISPNKKGIVSVGYAGEIIFWELPSPEDMIPSNLK